MLQDNKLRIVRYRRSVSKIRD